MKTLRKAWYINWTIAFICALVYSIFIDNNLTEKLGLVITLIIYFGLSILLNQYKIMERIK